MANERTIYEDLDREIEAAPSGEATEASSSETDAVRTPRENDTREVQDQRMEDAWVPQSMLPTPTPRDGIGFRWVRTSALGKADNANVSRKFREMWTPVKREDHPELEAMSDLDSRFPENIEIGGLLLCQAPIELIEKRRAYFEGTAERQMESVDNNFFRENDPRMPLLAPERRTRTQFRRG